MRPLAHRRPGGLGVRNTVSGKPQIGSHHHLVYPSARAWNQRPPPSVYYTVDSFPTVDLMIPLIFDSNVDLETWTPGALKPDTCSFHQSPCFFPLFVVGENLCSFDDTFVSWRQPPRRRPSYLGGGRGVGHMHRAMSHHARTGAPSEGGRVLFTACRVQPAPSFLRPSHHGESSKQTPCGGACVRFSRQSNVPVHV